jgi:hypothetical protein
VTGPLEPPVGAVAVIQLNDGQFASARRIAEAYEDAENHGWVFTGSHYAHPWAHVVASGRLITVYTPEVTTVLALFDGGAS